ncbi:RNA polymerase sigma factor [Nonomuraea sp. KM90]|uniref:RNA polymerase sigma factor n=1 Tax=Nonomuraea sp. KM90 TaxID=3457428 RepID=UPI003FCE2B7C
MSDQTGFTGLFEEYYEAVLRYAWRRVGAADAPDVAAETFRIAWEKYDRLPHDQPLPWLYTTARRVVSNHIRSSKRRDGLVASLADGLLRHGDESDHAAIVATRHAALAALDDLSEDDRELVLLLAWKGLIFTRRQRRSAARGQLPGCGSIVPENGYTDCSQTMVSPPLPVAIWRGLREQRPRSCFLDLMTVGGEDVTLGVWVVVI